MRARAWPWLIQRGMRTRVIAVRRAMPYGVATSWFVQFQLFDDGHVETVPVLNQIILTSSPGSLQSWPVPGDWNSGTNKIECIGGTAQASGSAIGGAAYANSINVALTPGGTASYEIGAITSTFDTWFNGATLAASSCGAKGTSSSSGGAASGCVFNNFAWSGGGASGTGGGGAGGPNGAGGSSSSSTGGTADGGTVAGGTSGNSGNSGTEFDATHGCGSGGGQFNTGGLYGGGAGNGLIGGGTQGIIVITYTPAVPFDPWPQRAPVASFMTPKI